VLNKYADLALFVNLTAEQRVNLPPLKGTDRHGGNTQPTEGNPSHPMNNNNIPLPPLNIS